VFELHLFPHWVVGPRSLPRCKGFNLAAIFDFLGELVHGSYHDICPRSDARLPGWIKSDMTARVLADEKSVGAVMPRIPMRRFGEPTDFGGIAVYLMSTASSYHTADCFVIDGGYTAF
jgi:hypothetical protein